MTTPDPTAGLLRSLDDNPEFKEEIRQRLLTQELLDLPNTVAQMAVSVSEMRDVFDKRVTALEERFDGFQAQQSENTEQLNSIRQTLDSLDSRVDSLDGRVSNITGSDYERKATRRTSNLLSRYLRLEQIQVIHSPLQETASYLVQVVNDALKADTITTEQADDLDQADIIVLAKDPDGKPTHLVAEASVTIDESDIDRAYQRAQVLQRITESPAIAAVIGTAISDANRQRAAGTNVVILTLRS